MRYIALTGGLALMAGLWMLLAGVIGLGFVTRFLSRPLLLGYVAGSAIVMIVSQLDSLIGIKLEAQDDTLAELSETIRRLGETDLTTLLVGLGVIGVVLACAPDRPPPPGLPRRRPRRDRRERDRGSRREGRRRGAGRSSPASRRSASPP